MNGIIETFLLAMTPIGELRASIPIALAVYKLNPVLVYFISVIGNLIPVIFLLIFLEPVSKFLIKKSKTFEKFFNWLFVRTRKRVGERMQKKGALALIAFVAIPLPITGAWTGSAIAFLFNIPFKKAFLALFAGILIAGLIVTFATISGIAIEHYFGWQTLLAIIVIVLISFLLKLKIKNLIKI